MRPNSESQFMKQLIIFNQYKTCVEIGVANGSTTIQLCAATQKTGGHVYGFDCWAQHGLKKQFKPQDTKTNVENRIQQAGYKNYTLHKIDTTTNEFKTLLIKECPKIDFAFIDGCHSYIGLKNDFDQVYPLLSKTGTIAFHDTLRIDGCREFILDLRTKYFDGTYDIVDFPWGFGKRRAGISLLIKRSYPIVKLYIDEICGSLSTPQEIITREKKWFDDQIQIKSQKLEISIDDMLLNKIGKIR